MILRVLVVFICGLLLDVSDSLTVSNFQKVSDGIWDAWNRSNSENVRGQARFAMQYGNGNLWFVSRRLFRHGFDHPWDPAGRGGIVSTFHVASRNWSHIPYDRLDDDVYGDNIFSLNGRLFMLTHSANGKINYHKLFFWDDDSARWLETPFDIDPAATTVSAYSIPKLVVGVPKQDQKVAYFIASTHENARRGSEMAYAKLDVDFRGNVPVKATLKSLARQQAGEPSAVFMVAQKNDKLIAFIQNFYSEGYMAETGFAYTLDLNTNLIGNISLGKGGPGVDFHDERVFQTENELFIAGGTQMYGLGQLRNVKSIWSLNLTNFQWDNTNASIPENAGWIPAFDQQHKKLYMAGLKEGIYVSDIA